MYKNICITNRGLCVGSLTDQIRRILGNPPDLLILREKDLSLKDYTALAAEVLELCKGTKTKVILHSFTNAALALSYPHIHMTLEAFLSLSEEEKSFFETIGVSTHAVSEAVLCEKMGASYVTASHIFETDCKKRLAPRGLSYLAETVSAVEIPVYALGGIHEDNISDCIRAGAAGVCRMSEYMRL